METGSQDNSHAPETSAANGNAAAENNASNNGAEAGSTSGDDTAKRIAELQAQVQEKESKYVYLYADFENFKKRSIKERSDLLKFGWESVARDLLQVVDNLERALAHASPSTDKNLVEGLKMVLNQFHSTLDRQGVKPVESLKQTFNPELHEAIAQEPSDAPAGLITQEHTKGYTLHGRLLRPARVVVSQGTGEKPTE